MTRSDRNTGQYRAYRGSGCVGILPKSKAGSGPGTRRKTKPLRRPHCHKPDEFQQIERGRSKQVALVERAGIRPRVNPLVKALRRAFMGA